MTLTENKPDIVSKVEIGGVTFEVREYFDGKQTLEEIITKRILNELNKDEPSRKVSIPERA